MENEFPIHPAANIFPMIGEDDFEALKRDISERGQMDDICIFDGQILDGRNRYRACCELNIEPQWCEVVDCDDPIAYVLSKNLYRRQLNQSQRAQCAAEVARLREGRPNKTNPQTCGVSATEAAKAFNVSTRSVETAKHVASKGDKSVVDAVKSGEITVSAAAKLVNAVPDKKEQRKLVKDGKKAIASATKNAPAKQKPSQCEPKHEGDFCGYMNEAMESALKQFDPPTAVVVAWCENKAMQFK